MFGFSTNKHAYIISFPPAHSIQGQTMPAGGEDVHHYTHTQLKHSHVAWLNIYSLQLSNSHYRLSQLCPPVCGSKEKKTANNLGFLEKACVYIVVARRIMFECSLSRSWVLVVGYLALLVFLSVCGCLRNTW